jgi:transcriptional regulator with XRE-family HTH domain
LGDKILQKKRPIEGLHFSGAVLLHFVAKKLAFAPPDLLSQRGMQEFRNILMSEFDKRCRRNPRYSLRSFSKTLRISHATLSHLLSGNRPVTAKTAKRLAKELGFSEGELTSEPSPLPRLDDETFAVIADWYHDAILELSRTQGFRWDAKWIARRIGIGSLQTKSAMERLVRLGFMQKDKNGIWREALGNTTTAKPNRTSHALRRNQLQILELSMRALEEVPITNRDHTSTTIAMNPADLPEVKNRIQRFRRELMDYLQRNPSGAEEVYQLSVGFFPLTTSDRQRGKQ